MNMVRYEYPRASTLLRRLDGQEEDEAECVRLREELMRKREEETRRRRSGVACSGRDGLVEILVIEAAKDAPPEARSCYQRYLQNVALLLGGEAIPEEVRSAAIATYPHLSAPLPLLEVDEYGEERAARPFVVTKNIERRAEKIRGLIGPIESQYIRRAIDAAAELSEWASSLSMETQGKGKTSIGEGKTNCSSSSTEFGMDRPYRSVCSATPWWAEWMDEADIPQVPNSKEATHDNNNVDVALLYSQREEEEETSTSAASDCSGMSSIALLEWFRGKCSRALGDNAEMVIMHLMRALVSDANDEICATELLGLLGDSGIDVVFEILPRRKAISAAFRERVVQVREIFAEEKVSEGRPLYPAVPGSQVSISTETEKEFEKMRKKDARRQARLASSVGQFEEDISWVTSHGFEILFQDKARLKEIVAAESPFDGLIGTGEGMVGGIDKRVLPPGTERKNYKGYEEVHVPAAKAQPTPKEGELVEIASLEGYVQTGFKGYKTLNRIQSRIHDVALGRDENILVCAPTGAGKTNIAMLTIMHEVGKHIQDDGSVDRKQFKVVYIAPMKALASEVVAAFSKRLSSLNIIVKELTGDMQLTKKEIEDTQMIVTTPEKWDVVTRKSSDVAVSSLVRLLIIDEVHLLNDERGSVIETLVARTLRQVETSQSHIRIVGLSATLPNYKDVALFLRVNLETGLFYFDASYRPVPLRQQYIGVSEPNFAKKNQLMTTIALEKVVSALKREKQAMIFVHSRKDTAKTARMVADLAERDGDAVLFIPDTHEQYGLAVKDVAKARSSEVKELFAKGLGVHHAGMLRSDRNLTERLFSQGLIKVLVCTATLAWGVNLPAHTVIIKGTTLYNQKLGTFTDVGMLDVAQIFGRAGRPQFDNSGEGIIITSHDRLSHYLGMMTHKTPIESQFVERLKDNLNAEVVLGTVTNVREACNWLGYTYLYVRMKRNPLVYGIDWDEVQTDPQLHERRRKLITNTARALDSIKMMRFDERSGNLYPTETGRVASHFYIKHETIEMFNDNLFQYMNESDILSMICKSSEFENVAVRDEEMPEISKLSRYNVCHEVKGGKENRHGKVNILLQTYISRGRPESFSLCADTSYISQNAGRICRSLFEIALRRGWSSLSATLLELSKAIERQIWPQQSELRQFEGILSPEQLSKLESRGASIARLRDMNASEIGSILRHPAAGSKVLRLMRMFPDLLMEVNVQPITRSVLRVIVNISVNFEWKDSVHGGSLRWLLWVEDSDNEHMYHSEVWSMNKKMTQERKHVVAFTIPIFEPMPPQYFIRMISDSWLNSESIQEISFKDLILPSRHPPHTELLDLTPLPISALGKQEYESLYKDKFKHFNPIQTQVFHTLYHTDVNLLLGAPTGSGKTISSEIAMMRVFSRYPGSKVIYIAPLKALVRERIKDWSSKLCPKLGVQLAELTGDHTPDMKVLLDADIIVATPEKWDGISRNWKNRGYVKKVALLVIDEIHLLGNDRGPILEVIVSRMNYISKQTQNPVRIIGLSTALSNARDLGDWMGIGDLGLFNFKPAVRPVPLEVHIQGFPGKFYCPRMATMNKPCYAAIGTHSPSKPVLIFVSSRRQTRLTALDVISYAAADDNPGRFLHCSDDVITTALTRVKDSTLRHTLQFGIGIHHAGLTEVDRLVVEELFCGGSIQVLVATSTLAWGVNFPAHLVIVKGTEYFDGATKRYVDFPITDVLQMMGRAGRPQFDKSGKAVIMVHDPKKSFYKKFLYEPFPVESNLPEVLPDHFNAEIVNGTISTKQEGVDYLTWTFFYRRLLQNPSYYGLDNIEDSSVNEFLSELVESTVNTLEDAGTIFVDEDKIRSLPLGKIASYYYLQYSTAELFSTSLKEELSMEELVQIVCNASEYDELPVRHNEDLLNAELANDVRWDVDRRAVDDPHTKAFLLLQAHFGRIQLPISDYVTDTKSVLEQTMRIMQAIIELSATEGWLETTLLTMRLMQMIVQGRFQDDNSLLMLPGIETGHLKHLSKKMRSIKDALQCSSSIITEVLRSKTIGLDSRSVANACRALNRLPRVKVSVDSIRPDEESNNTWIMEVKLVLMNSRRSHGKTAFAPRYPKIKDEGWWVVIGSHEGKLLGMQRAQFTYRTTAKVRFENPKSSKGIFVDFVSDSYIGLDQRIEVRKSEFPAETLNCGRCSEPVEDELDFWDLSL